MWQGTRYRQINGACTTLALKPLQRVVVSALCCVIGFVEFNGRSAKAAVITCFRPSFLNNISLPTGLMPASSSSSCCFCVCRRETAVVFFVKHQFFFFALYCPCNRYLFLLNSTYTCCSFLGPFTFGSSCITLFTTPQLSFVFFYFLFPFFFSFLFYCCRFFHVLAFFVVLSYPVHQHFTCFTL